MTIPTSTVTCNSSLVVCKTHWLLFHSFKALHPYIERGRRWHMDIPEYIIFLFETMKCMLLFQAIATVITIGRAYAKKVSGKVALTGTKSEIILTKFAIPPAAEMSISLSVTIPESRGMYVDERMLRVHVFSDEDWPLVRRAPTCHEKVQRALKYFPLSFNLEKFPKGKGFWKASIVNEIITLPEAFSSRASFWYWIIDDCSLESSFHRLSDTPPMDFELIVRSRRRHAHSLGDNQLYIESHLSADHEGLGTVLSMTLIISALLCIFMVFRISKSLLDSRTGATIHIAQILVLLLVMLQMFSSIFELLHFAIYLMNGFGNYALDAISGQAEALCDGLIAIVLLYVGSGWTLPHHVANISASIESSSSYKKKTLLERLSSPIFSGLRSPNEQGRFWWIVPSIVLILHVAIAQWSRIFNDDFDSYHSLEHSSGRALMWLRFSLCFIFVSGTNALRQSGRCPRSLNSFLTKFLIVGIAWFVSLPFVSVSVSSLIPAYLKHKALVIGSTVVQVSSIASLVWLFSSNSEASAYHRVSKTKVTHGEDDLTDLSYTGAAMASYKRIFNIGSTKIRLD